jgi:hypothetical protein
VYRRSHVSLDEIPRSDKVRLAYLFHGLKRWQWGSLACFWGLRLDSARHRSVETHSRPKAQPFLLNSGRQSADVDVERPGRVLHCSTRFSRRWR